MQLNVRRTVNVPLILPVTSLNTFRLHTDVRSVYYRAGRTQNGRTAITGYDTQVFAACAKRPNVEKHFDQLKKRTLALNIAF